MEYLKKAFINKKNGKSTILDCFFDKLMSRMLGCEGMDSFIYFSHVDYPSILEIAKEDEIKLPDADIIIFLYVSKEL